MLETDAPCAILITGPFGVGKSAVTVEIANLLEGEVAYAAIDLDWLMWYDDRRSEGHSDATTDMLARNLAGVVANYREAGVRLFVLAGSVRAADELRALRAAVRMPMIVVRLCNHPRRLGDVSQSPTHGGASLLAFASASAGGREL